MHENVSMKRFLPKLVIQSADTETIRCFTMEMDNSLEDFLSKVCPWQRLPK